MSNVERRQTNPGRRPALFRSLIERALREHHTMALRSEQHGDFEELYVDADQLQLLKNPDWQVIYGRRGTGKTFLLGMLKEQSARSADDRVVSILLTAQDFVVSPMGRSVDDKARALGYFQTFLELLVAQLTACVEELLGRPRFIDVITSSRKRLEGQVEDILLDLLNLAQDGRPILAFADVSYEEVKRDARNTGRGADVALAGGSSSSGATGSARANVSAQQKREKASEASVRFTGTPVPRYALVRRRLIELLELLQIEHFNILIDEWSVLDPTAATAIQPEFADLLKRTFAGSPRISLKIATNRYQTRFSNRAAGARYRGLEIGADIFEATNLDRALLSQPELDRFYETLVFKRLRHRVPELSRFAPDGERPDREFILSIFKDRRAFTELVKGAEGIPRDFLIIFKKVAHDLGFSVRELWSARNVQDRIREKSVAGQGEVEYRSEAGQLLAPCVKEVVTSTGSRSFLIRRDDVGPLENALDELLEKRLIHEIPRADLAADIRDSFQGYLLDYGLWLDWQHALGHRDEDDERADIPFDVARYEHYIIDPSQIDMAGVRHCPHCDSVFSERSRSFQVAGLCPECFRNPDEGVRDAI